MKGETVEWNPWVKFSQYILKSALAAGFVSSSARFFMMAYPMLLEAG